jgi:TolB protein
VAADPDHFNRIYQPELARGGAEICRLAPHTGAMAALTSRGPNVWDFRCCASPDGRLIAFCRAETGELPGLWVMKADGSDPRLLTRGLRDQGADHPRWVP